MTDEPDRHTFDSTAILEGVYRRDSQELQVTFRGGNTYTMLGVPPDLWDGLLNASSPGSFFNARIRGKY
jgi:KTSC domain